MDCYDQECNNNNNDNNTTALIIIKFHHVNLLFELIIFIVVDFVDDRNGVRIQTKEEKNQKCSNDICPSVCFFWFHLNQLDSILATKMIE